MPVQSDSANTTDRENLVARVVGVWLLLVLLVLFVFVWGVADFLWNEVYLLL